MTDLPKPTGVVINFKDGTTAHVNPRYARTDANGVRHWHIWTSKPVTSIDSVTIGELPALSAVSIQSTS